MLQGPVSSLTSSIVPCLSLLCDFVPVSVMSVKVVNDTNKHLYVAVYAYPLTDDALCIRHKLTYKKARRDVVLVEDFADVEVCDYPRVFFFHILLLSHVVLVFFC